MATVLAVYTSDGCVGRCDARCHEAAAPECDCICGGRNHGAGLQRAMENNREMVGLTQGDLDRFAKAHGYKPEDLKVVDRLKTNASRARSLTKRSLRPRRNLVDLFG